MHMHSINQSIVTMRLRVPLRSAGQLESFAMQLFYKTRRNLMHNRTVERASEN